MHWQERMEINSVIDQSLEALQKIYEDPSIGAADEILCNLLIVLGKTVRPNDILKLVGLYRKIRNGDFSERSDEIDRSRSK